MEFALFDDVHPNVIVPGSAQYKLFTLPLCLIHLETQIPSSSVGAPVGDPVGVADGLVVGGLDG